MKILATHTLSLALMLFTNGCGATPALVPMPTPLPTPDAMPSTQTNEVAEMKSATCALLTSDDINAVQGEKYAGAQGSEHLANGLVTSQCFYRLPTFDKSISLEVVRLDPKAKATDALQKYWRERFHPEAIEKRERERELKEEAERKREEELEREKASGSVREGGYAEEKEEEGDEEKSPPQRVARLGKAAFWSGGEKSGALSVLTKDAVIRINMGGDENTPAKIKKASALARKILKHF